MHGHSRSTGSFTLTTISALAHTSAALGTTVPPAARYASSANPEPSPAPCSTITLCPSPTSDSTPAGTSATRCSAVLISLGTPTIMRAARLSVTVFRDASPRRLSVFAQPYDRLPLRSKEFRRDARHVLCGKPRDRRQHLVEALVRLAVDRKTGQTIHPRRRTLQRQHQLALGLLLRFGERLPREAGTGQLRVLFADRRLGLDRGLGLGADVHARDAHLPVEAREGVDRVGQP